MTVRLKLVLAFIAASLLGVLVSPGVTKAVDETSQSAMQMLQVSRDLSRQGEQLKHMVENFLDEVAATEANAMKCAS